MIHVKFTVDDCPRSASFLWNGTKIWHKKDDLHRESGPAIKWASGYEAWYFNHMYHRDDDGPTITYPNGNLLYVKHGMVHRVNGPAEIMGKRRFYYYNGKKMLKRDWLLAIKNG